MARVHTCSTTQNMPIKNGCRAQQVDLLGQLVHGAEHVKLDLRLLQEPRPSPYAGQVCHHCLLRIGVLHLYTHKQSSWTFPHKEPGMLSGGTCSVQS